MKKLHSCIYFSFDSDYMMQELLKTQRVAVYVAASSETGISAFLLRADRQTAGGVAAEF